MHIFLFFILMPVLALVYAGIGFFIAKHGFYKARQTPNDTAEEKKLIKSWSQHLSYGYGYAKPKITLEEFYKSKAPNRKDAALAQAYRRMFWSPVWPLLVVGDVYRGYQKAKVGERIYLLEKSAKDLERAMSNRAELEKAHKQAQEAIKKATVSQ